MGVIDKIIGVLSIVIGFILVVIGVNKGYLDLEDITIMYWLIGIMIGTYIVLWIIVGGLIWKFIKFIFRSLLGR